MNAPKKWLHIRAQSGNNIIKRIYAAMNNANIKQSDKLIEYGISLSDRLDIIPRIAWSLSEYEKKIYDQYEVKNHTTDQIYEAKKQGYVVKINNDIKDYFLIYLDSLIFELNSACELLKSFFEEIQKVAGISLLNNKTIGKQISEILKNNGHDDTWFRMLDDIRNHYIHESFPWFAIDVTNAKDAKYDILIMKKNILIFNDDKDFYRLSDINKISFEFRNCVFIIEDYLVKLLKEGSSYDKNETD